MNKLSNIAAINHDKILIMGDSGSGKSVLASMLPGPILFFDFDGKISSVANYWRERDPARLDQISFNSYLEPARRHRKYNPSSGDVKVNAFSQFYNDFHQLMQQKPFPYATIVIDSLTTLTSAMMNEIMQQNAANKRVDEWTPAQQDYLIFANHIRSHISQWLAAPSNVVMIAHIDFKDDPSGRTIKAPKMWTRFSTEMPLHFTEAWRLTASKDGRVLQTLPSSDFSFVNSTSGVPDGAQASWDVLKKYLNCGKRQA